LLKPTECHHPAVKCDLGQANYIHSFTSATSTICMWAGGTRNIANFESELLKSYLQFLNKCTTKEMPHSTEAVV